MSRNGASLSSSGILMPARAHSRVSARRLAAEGEGDRARVVDAERPRVVRPRAGRRHARRRRARGRRAAPAAASAPVARPPARRRPRRPARRAAATSARNVVRRRAAEQRRLLELLGDDHRDEVRLAARQPPHLLEHGVDASAPPVEDLELGAPCAKSDQRGRMPGSVCRPGMWIARNVPSRIIRAYQSALSAQRRSTRPRARSVFVAGGAAATARTPARSRRPTRR